MPQVHVNVAVADDAAFENTIGRAKELGFKVERSLDLLGVATGSIDRDALVALRKVPGVQTVEEDREVHAMGAGAY